METENPNAAPQPSTKEQEVNLVGIQPNEEDKAWRAWLRKNREDAPQRLEEAAKYLSGMVSICFTIFLSIHKQVFEGVETAWQVNWAVPLWLGSVLLTLFVLLPLPYGVDADSSTSIKRSLKRMVRVKYSLLILAVVLFVIALIMLAGLYVYGVKKG
ncbi:hypothetical protein [Haliscomenobacter sp.]|uniref:hypothetical protein n=1 Tax=Haliscomenobacter sp. TaxID=2717303 RepID=UPI003BA9505F